MKTQNTSKKRPIILALSVIVLCVTLMVGGTYSLFSDSASFRTHLQAGTLDVTLTRTAYAYSVINSSTGEGTIITASKTDDYTDSADLTNAFELPENAVIAPTNTLSATFEIKNNGNVAFTYTVKLIVIDPVSGAELADTELLKLHEQLKLTLTDTSNNKQYANPLYNLTITDPNFVANGATRTFKVDVEFLNLENAVNNTAMTQRVAFDLVVEAIQATEAQTA